VRNAAFIIILTAIISGCVSTTPPPDSVITAQPFVGLQERQNRTELRELTGVDPVRTEWCAAFVNAVLEIDSIPNLNDQDKYPPLMARSFLYWGERVERADIQRGDVVIFPRGNQGWQGHVGFYVETQFINDREYWVILGGNQNNEVRYDLYSPSRAIGIRRYPNDTINTTAR
jgi:uncharacterized protein (TIGR02594 family)